MVRTFLKVYMELVSYFLFLQEQIKDIIIIESNPYTPLMSISYIQICYQLLQTHPPAHS